MTLFSPASWDSSCKLRAEDAEKTGWLSQSKQEICANGSSGIISATASPIAVQAGLNILENDGTAADAAATIALTQIATQLGSVASYAGILSLVYYDANDKRVHSLDAGFNSYRAETNPLTIPVGGGRILSTLPPQEIRCETEYGRKTLVPGFLAGIEAMHQKFGRLDFAALFEPAIYYARRGIVISDWLEHYFWMQQDHLRRTAEGRSFIKQAGNDLPRKGDLFLQLPLAETLQAVAQHGAAYCYQGKWATEFVDIIGREGGKVTSEDLALYSVLWSEPQSTNVFGHKVYSAGGFNEAASKLFLILQLAQALKLETRLDYWKDPLVIRDIQRILDVADLGSSTPSARLIFEKNGISFSPGVEMLEQFALAVAPLLDEICTPASNIEPRHSNSIVVIDKGGNIAALTHSINAVAWGDTGIVIGGIPISDAASFQQHRLSKLPPGGRVPNEMTQAICFERDRPVFAMAAIGASSIPESFRLILDICGKRKELATTQSNPPLFYNFQHLSTADCVSARGIVVASSSYEPSFLDELSGLISTVHQISDQEAMSLRGTVAAATIDDLTQTKRAVEIEGMLLFAGATEQPF